MAAKISASVGKGGKNKPEDVQAVQEMLNDFTKLGGFKKLDVDGQIGPKTLSAIAAFQTEVVGMPKADSRIDPGGESVKVLSAGASRAAAEQKKAEKAEQKETAAKEKEAEKGKDSGAPAGDPQVKGDVKGIDKGILAVLEAVSAHYGKPIVVEKGKEASTLGSVDPEGLWNDWCSSLDRGKKEASLSSNNQLRGELDKLYNHGKHDEFLKLVATEARGSKGKGKSAHTDGRAIDIKRNTDSKVVAALATILRQENEGDVIHFDDGGKSVPRTITEAMKKKWK
ncbi:MAG: peptidoglycan-binding domain-containing protein [Lacipirellulaceae bacterium]